MNSKEKSLKTYRAIDVSNHIIRYYQNTLNCGIDALKLQRVLFLLQGVYLACNNKPLFEDEFYAWGCGPTTSEVRKNFRRFGTNWIYTSATKYEYIEDDTSCLGMRLVEWVDPLTKEDKANIDAVCLSLKDISSVSLLCFIRKQFPSFSKRENSKLMIPKSQIKEDFSIYLEKILNEEGEKNDN